MTKEYQTYLTNLAERLENFNLKLHGEIYENYKRNNLYLYVLISEFANTEHYNDCCALVKSLNHHAGKKHQAPHTIIAEGLRNEVNRRQNKPIEVGIKFPKWLEHKRNLDILCLHLEYLLGADNIVKKNISPEYEEDALSKAEKHIKAELEHLYSINY